MSRPIAISDSANFYVSTERIFNPALKNVPVIVLSNNDGCAVARSDEAKALGIKMGAPLHLIRDKIKAHGVRVFSSNYTLYGDISRRVTASSSSAPCLGFCEKITLLINSLCCISGGHRRCDVIEGLKESRGRT